MRLVIRWMIEVGIHKGKSFLSYCIRSGTHEISFPMGNGVPFPGTKVTSHGTMLRQGNYLQQNIFTNYFHIWPGRDADHSSPSSAEVKNEQELYLFSPRPPGHVVGLLYFYFHILLTCLPQN
jgi:hypothetical protein